MSIGTTVPNLVLAQRVIDNMVATGSRFVEEETGEALVGLVTAGVNTNGVPTIYVLDTIPPDESAVRETYAFKQGDERQYEIFTWLYENWEHQRAKRRDSYGTAQQAKWDAPLSHLGDWHKQPGYMIAPSSGDLMSALAQMDDDENDQEFLLAPIVTMGHPSTTGAGAGVNYVTVPLEDGSNVRIDFWYIHRDVGMFQPISPTVYPDDQLPGLTPYPWHIADEERAEAEFARFYDHEMFYSILLWDADGKLPLDVCISAARADSSKVFLIITPWNYPEKPPIIRLAPHVELEEDESIYDAFAQWWAESEPAPELPGWEWAPDKYLIDYIIEIEDALGLRPEPVEPEPSEAEAEAPEEPIEKTADATPAEATDATEPESAAEDNA